MAERTELDPLILDRFPLLAQISLPQQTALAHEMAERDYPGGRALFMEDAWGNAVFLLLEGWVRVRHSSATGTTTLAILGPGAFFGEMAVLDQAPRSTDVVALTPVKVLMIPAPKFKELLSHEASVAYYLAQQLAKRLRQSNQRRYLQSQPQPIRLIHTLVQLGEAYGPQLLLLPPQDLADLAEIPVEMVTKVLEKLHTQNVIQLDPANHKMILTQFEKLVQTTQSL